MGGGTCETSERGERLIYVHFGLFGQYNKKNGKDIIAMKVFMINRLGDTVFF